MTLYSSIQKQLVCNWNDKWYEMSKLILDELFTKKEVEWSLRPRSDVDELLYLRLRFWFIDHETKFLPIWRSYVSCGAWELQEF
jgi:hypothetical protein